MTNLKRHLGALAAGIAATALIAGAALADPALIYDGGGKFDKSFNEAAYTGAELYKKETGGAYGDLEISGDAQREQAIRQFAQKGFSPIVVPGFSWATALTTVAAEFPETHFVIIDSVVDLPNVRSVVFKEQEGSYLVGILAAMASKTGTIGVVPAFNFDLLEAFALRLMSGPALTPSTIRARRPKSPSRRSTKVRTSSTRSPVAPVRACCRPRLTPASSASVSIPTRTTCTRATC